ncbi:hypothetical protein [Pseudomonas rhizoryzae]|uniref:hypothetical protein n=1 Tax=Pseudomonas rhizoryzae TaxID=2571129 RepID=UPI0010C1A72D|nr:hypothetical protein [Pseudomonas rhizoryzae]
MQFDDSPTLYERVGPIPYRDRNYFQFGVMANVRRDTPYALEPRGIPEDVSPEVLREVERMDCDGHSHSHLTLLELQALAARLQAETSDEEHAWALEGLNALIASVEEEGISPEDIRVVFFFYN